MRSPSNLHNFSATTQQRIAADESVWADPTYTNSKDNAEDMEYQQPCPGCSHHQELVTLTFPKRIVDSVDICCTADHLRLSDNQVTPLVSSTLKAGGADLEQFVISVSTT